MAIKCSKINAICYIDNILGMACNRFFEFSCSVEMIYKGKNFVEKEALIELLSAKEGNLI